MTEDNKSKDWLMSVQTLLVAVTTVIMTAGIPWAYMIGNKVTAIEIQVTASADNTKDIKSSSGIRLTDLERRMTSLETEMTIIKQLAEGARNRAQGKQ